MVDFNLDFLDKPENRIAMGEIAEIIGGEDSIGGKLGGLAGRLTKEEQLQGARVKQGQSEAEYRKGMLEYLKGGGGLSPTADNDGFDSMTQTGDGDISFKMKNTPQRQFDGEQSRLEELAPQGSAQSSYYDRPKVGADLPDFL